MCGESKGLAEITTCDGHSVYSCSEPSLDNLSIEQARPMYVLGKNKVNETETRLLDMRWRFGPANYIIHVTPRKSNSPPVCRDCFLDDKKYKFLNSRLLCTDWNM